MSPPVRCTRSLSVEAGAAAFAVGRFGICVWAVLVVVLLDGYWFARLLVEAGTTLSLVCLRGVELLAQSVLGEEWFGRGLPFWHKAV